MSKRNNIKVVWIGMSAGQPHTFIEHVGGQTIYAAYRTRKQARQAYEHVVRGALVWPITSKSNAGQP